MVPAADLGLPGVGFWTVTAIGQWTPTKLTAAVDRRPRHGSITSSAGAWANVTTPVGSPKPNTQTHGGNGTNWHLIEPACLCFCGSKGTACGNPHETRQRYAQALKAGNDDLTGPRGGSFAGHDPATTDHLGDTVPPTPAPPLNRETPPDERRRQVGLLNC